MAGICSSNGPSLTSCDQMFRAVSSPSTAGSAGGFADVVADKNAFERDRRLRALVGGDFDVERGDDLGGGGCFVVEVGGVLQDFAGDGDAGLQSLGGAEFAQQPVLQGDFLDLVNDRLGLLDAAPGNGRPSSTRAWRLPTISSNRP